LPRKKFRIIFKVQIVNLEEDKKKTCSEKMGGGDDE
jgi:hypothetical protein